VTLLADGQRNLSSTIDLLLSLGAPCSTHFARQLLRLAFDRNDRALLDLFITQTQQPFRSLMHSATHFRSFDGESWNAVHYACSVGKVAFAQVLLQVNQIFNPSSYVFHVDDRTSFVGDSQESRPSQTALHIASRNGKE
jgi:hypothetical protein